MDRYSNYKDSGVKWLGQVPSHWEIKRLGSYFSERREKVSDKDFEALSVTKNGIFRQLENVAKSNDGDNRKKVCKNDFVINSRSDRKGSSGVSCLDGSVSLINIVMQPRKGIIPDFCNYLLKSNAFVEEFYRNGRGIVADLWTTRFDEMKSIKLAVPPINEQVAMVSYLDMATAKIDKAISQQREMLNLLSERKQIIIKSSVTGGINTDVNKKNSEVPWIGDIPTHWSVLKIRNLLEQGKDGIKIGPFGSSLTGKVESDLPYKVYGQWNITSNDFMAGKNYVSKETYASLQSYDVVSGDILVSMMGTVGKCAIVPKDIRPGIMDSHVIKIRLNQSIICNDFFVLAYDKDNNIGTYDAIQVLKKGSIMDGLNSSIVKDIKIAIPPTIEEQKAIVDYVKMRTKPINNAISCLQSTISLLQERKQIIINEVVTGKIKIQ